MIALWFALLAFTLILFVVLDGWNIGAGVLHLVLARTEEERRRVVAALGPLWSWHEVWLIAAGGVFLLAFPRAMAASFAGFYLALWLVLWAFILRGIALELGGHLDDPLWCAAWHTVFTGSSVLLALLFGVALGNVVRGVPIGASGRFSMELFTTFDVCGDVGILDWYTLSVGAFAAVLLAAHGAVYLRLRTSGVLNQRAATAGRWAWTAVALLFPVVTFETWLVRPELFDGIAARPLAWVALVGIAGGVFGLSSGLRGAAEGRALVGSSAIVAGLLASVAAGIFPDMLHSTLAPGYSLTASAGATTPHGLAVALFWWPVAAALAFTYAAIVARRSHGKV
jgi:cytochrome bd ubiquinol oxidase subunit II